MDDTGDPLMSIQNNEVGDFVQFHHPQGLRSGLVWVDDLWGGGHNVFNTFFWDIFLFQKCPSEIPITDNAHKPLILINNQSGADVLCINFLYCLPDL